MQHHLAAPKENHDDQAAQHLNPVILPGKRTPAIPGRSSIALIHPPSDPGGVPLGDPSG
jgi:hypothetical protein